MRGHACRSEPAQASYAARLAAVGGARRNVLRPLTTWYHTALPAMSTCARGRVTLLPHLMAMFLRLKLLQCCTKFKRIRAVSSTCCTGPCRRGRAHMPVGVAAGRAHQAVQLHLRRHASRSCRTADALHEEATPGRALTAQHAASGSNVADTRCRRPVHVACARRHARPCKAEEPRSAGRPVCEDTGMWAPHPRRRERARRPEGGQVDAAHRSRRINLRLRAAATGHQRAGRTSGVVGARAGMQRRAKSHTRGRGTSRDVPPRLSVTTLSRGWRSCGGSAR